MGLWSRLDARFGFRTDRGRIAAGTWREGAGLLAGVLAVLTLLWLFIEPYTHRELGPGTALFDARTFLAFVYLLFYAFAVIFIGISFYNLGARRWRDRGRPSGFAGLPLVLALVAGSVHWLQPRVADVMSIWYVVGADIAFASVLVWTIVELGFLPPREP
ncbi:hypothetical protein [Methylocapsa palsarum]|uniref:DUF805 domain-containing protein n=1 Tax=Methylocapsa palsarum TaxID=1612308 RepID=A0A1I4AGF6_9HYPH|nr:hypothetical protein [Methylocapsa palsarum]SFK55021.1 hypothetical protein SAMN05444581_11062 [Methylocapsa palsarum]